MTGDMATHDESIIIEHATTNNLRNINVSIPKRRITVVTGVSGSGKSSLVFSTLAAESQRNASQGYSAYIRHLLPKYDAPDVERIEHLPFSIVVTQQTLSGNARSTVGTYSDLFTALRLLFSRVAKPWIGYSMAYSFNNPAGMCPRCQGLGTTTSILPSRLLNTSASLNEGAILFPTFQPGGWRLTRYTDSGFFDNDLPLEQWPQSSIELLLHGGKQKPPHPAASWHKTASYLGLIPRIEQSFLNQGTGAYASEIKGITTSTTCPDCQGARVNERARSAMIEGVNIADCCAMSIVELRSWLSRLENSHAAVIIKELLNGIDNLMAVGLGYLSLSRTTTSLSGGEAQRLKLAHYLNSPLSDVLYIFDEPSVGLHPHDLIGVKTIFTGLRDKGNTVVIVDHDPDVIAIADKVIDLGPGAGSDGGEVVFAGSYHELLSSETATARALRHPGTLRSAPDDGARQHDSSHSFDISTFSARNLHNVAVSIPKDCLCTVTGVAGSGKSTLLTEGFMKQHRAVMLDQKAIHASSRSNILSYLGVFEALRKDFSAATHRSASLFSYNGEGACPGCKGKGIVTIDIAYLGESSYTCEDCAGSRYSPDALRAVHRGLNIAQALKLSAREARRRYPIPIGAAMRRLEDVGLDYLSIGQSLDTLSGGELQRLKLAKLLMERTDGALILDEPTSGLHESNIQQLIDLLRRLIRDQGLSIIVIEHNMRFIGQSDWVIDVGPGAGSEGGRILFEGSPQGLAAYGETPSGRALRSYFSPEPSKRIDTAKLS